MPIQKTNTQKVVRGLSSQTIVTITIGIVEIVSFSIMSRLLSQQDFGYYAAIVAVSAIFSSLSNNGIGSAIVQRKNINKKYIDNAFTLSFLIGLFVSLLLCLFSGVLSRSVADESMKTPLMLFSLTLLFQCMTSVNMALMQRQLMFIRMGIINLVSLIVTTIIAIILALRGNGYYAILTKVILNSFFTFLLSLLVAKVRYRFRFNFPQMKQIFGFSGWLMASSLFRNFANQIDRLLMSSLFSVSILGFYSRPKEFISNMTDKFNTIFDTTLFPVLSSIQDNKCKLIKSYEISLYFMNLMGILISMTFLINSELIIRIFFGAKWLNVNFLFQVLSLSSVLFINGRIGDIYLRSLGLTKFQFIFRVSQLFLTFFFIILIYKFGIIAVAIAAMTGYLTIAFLKAIYISHHIGLDIKTLIYSILKGWRCLLFIIPFYVICNIMIPHNLYGNICQIILYFIFLVCLFLLFPSSIGKTYLGYAYPRIITCLRKIHY